MKRVKIIKCSSKHYWYNDKIGKVFEITGNNPIIYGGFGDGVQSDSWECKNGNGIKKSDCVIIEGE